MVLPKSVLRGMQIGGTVLAIGLQTGCGNPPPQATTSIPKKVIPTAPPEKAPALTDEQLKILESAIPKLTSKVPGETETAWQTIFKLGRGAIEPLQAAAANNKGDAHLQRTIQYLIEWINAGGDPCPPCGMG